MTEQTTHILSIGCQIQEFTIQSVLGEGGFGITYLAHDKELDRKVAIKEYFPAEMTIRASDHQTVTAKSNANENYEFGLSKFLDEAKTLAQFTHPNIVRVSRFIRANNTAYLIMDYEQGEDLNDYLKRTNFQGGMPETEIKGYLVPILKGLQAVHGKGLLHRDVKPGNIYLRKDSEPMLIDFGAARYALGEHSKSMSAIISMGYAPPEQYSSKGKQNQASDLYAWGATAYHLITGKPPVESPDRSNAHFEGDPDPLTPLSQTHAGKYSKELLSTIDHCLQLPNKARPQSAGQVMAMLKGEQLKSNKTKKVNPSERFKNTKRKQSHVSSSTPIGDPSFRKPPKSNTLKYIIASLFVIALSAGSYFGYDYYQTQETQVESQRLADENDWAQAEQSNTIASYQSYLDKHPNGENQNYANDKIKQLKAQLGNLTIQAQKLLVKLGYQVPTDGQTDTRTTESIKAFEKSKNMIITGKADQVLMSSLKQAYSEKEQQAWKNAQGNITKLQDYAVYYPDGQYINLVEAKIQEIKEFKKANIEKQKKDMLLADNQAWKKAIEANSEASYKNYQSNFPNGIHLSKVSAKITKVRLIANKLNPLIGEYGSVNERETTKDLCEFTRHWNEVLVFESIEKGKLIGASINQNWTEWINTSLRTNRSALDTCKRGERKKRISYQLIRVMWESNIGLTYQKQKNVILDDLESFNNQEIGEEDEFWEESKKLFIVDGKLHMGNKNNKRPFVKL